MTCLRCGTEDDRLLCLLCANNLQEALYRKEQGMALAAEHNSDYLAVLRSAAVRVAVEGNGTADADRVRLWLDKKGISIPRGNFWGSIFKGKDWEFTGQRVRSTVVVGHANEIKVWRLV